MLNALTAKSRKGVLSRLEDSENREKKNRIICMKQRLNDADYQTIRKDAYRSTLQKLKVGILITLIIGGFFLLFAGLKILEMKDLLMNIR